MFPSVLPVVALLFLQLALVLGKPVSHSLALNEVVLDKRDSVSPPILDPSAKTVWKVGDKVTVTWNVTALNGAVPSNPLGKVLLGFMENPDDTEHLDIDHPLAQGFQILSGSVSFVVPPLPSRSNYIICLFGNSGNISPPFSILGTSDAPTTTTSVTTFTGTSPETDTPPPTLPSVSDPTKPTSGTGPLPHPSSPTPVTNTTQTSTSAPESSPTDKTGLPAPISAPDNTTTRDTGGARALSVGMPVSLLSAVAAAFLAGALSL